MLAQVPFLNGKLTFGWLRETNKQQQQQKTKNRKSDESTVEMSDDFL